MKKILFLLLALSMFNLYGVNKITVTIKNTSKLPRNREIVELDVKKIREKLKVDEYTELTILNSKAKPIAYQIASSNGQKESVIIFPVTIKAYAKMVFTIQKGKRIQAAAKVYGRLIPERKDDFAWENNRIAFRAYGPALQATGEISNGIDVWAKRTENLVINKWYSDDLSGKQSYHTDHGEGLDMYKVGPTLGTGATAPIFNDKLCFSKNFISSEVLDNGPYRICFKLNYAPFLVGDKEVKETRLITLDIENQLNKVSLQYEFADATLLLATGIVLRNLDTERTLVSQNKKYFLHAEPVDSTNGILYEAIVSAKPFQKIEIKYGHVLGMSNLSQSQNYTYYAGAGWSKWGFPTFEQWKKYVELFLQKLEKPLQVEII